MNASNPSSSSALLKPHQALLLFGVLALMVGALLPIAQINMSVGPHPVLARYSVTSAFWSYLVKFPSDYGLRIVSLLFWPAVAFLAYAYLAAQEAWRRHALRGLLGVCVAVFLTLIAATIDFSVTISRDVYGLGIRPDLGVVFFLLGGLLVALADLRYPRATPTSTEASPQA